MEESVASILLGLSYLLIGVAVLALVAFFFKKLAADPKSMKTSLIGVGVLAVLYFLGMAMAPEAPAGLLEKLEVSESIWTNVSATNFTMWTLMIFAFVGMIFGEVYKAFK